jgi:16S rRNA (guanine1207-N2)-methyltransferase
MHLNHPISYEQIHELRTWLGGQEVRYFSKPGIPNWDSIAPSTALLAEGAELKPAWQVLLMGWNQGALGTILGLQLRSGSVFLRDNHYAGTEMARRTLHANGIENAQHIEEIDLPSDLAGACDAVLVELPKGRKLAQRWLVEAHTALKPGGCAYLAGANQEGIRPVIRDGEALFGSASVMGYKKGSRVAKFVKPTRERDLPAWAGEAGIAEGTWVEFQAEGQSFRSLPGVFSFDRLDEGSALLLTCFEIPPGGRVLDLGCGWGILGLSAARSGAAQVDLVDVNLMAVAAAKENLALHGIQHARALPSDVASAVSGERYDLVVSNPPFHSGKKTDYLVPQAFISQARQVLGMGGRFLLVANRFLPYERLLREVFQTVERLREDGKYQVLAASLGG